MKTQVETLEAGFKKAGLQAILDHPNTKLWAKVNPEDKFVLVTSHLPESVILGVCLNFNQGWQWDWYNSMFNKPWYQEHNSKFRAFCNDIAREAYNQLK